MCRWGREKKAPRGRRSKDRLFLPPLSSEGLWAIKNRQSHQKLCGAKGFDLTLLALFQ